MQSAEKMKGELIGELQGKTVTRTIHDITPTGIKMAFNDEGQFTGKYSAGHMETVTVTLKTDGTSEWQTKAIENTPEGDLIVFTGGGTGKSTGPGTQSWEGELHAMTQSTKLAWLNNAKLWVEGSGNLAQATFHGKVYHQK